MIDAPPSQPPSASERRPPGWVFATAVALAFVAVSVARVLRHVMWRDEWRAWCLVNATHSLAELRAATRYDGHPILWSLLLYLLSRFTADVHAIQLLHIAIAGMAVWLLARFAPWRWWQILLVCAGYFVCFEYTIVSRNYGLGMLFLFGALASFGRRGDGRLLFGACCAGAIQSNPFITLVVTALGLTAFGDHALDWRRTRRRPTAIEWVWPLLPIASAGLALWAMLPGPTPRYAAPYDFSAPTVRLEQTLIGLWQSIVPIPAADDAWWNSSLLSIDPTTAGGEPALAIAIAAMGLVVIAAAVWLFWRRRLALTFLLLAWSIIFAFAFWQFAGTMRHQGHYFLALLGAWWLASSAASNESIPRKRLRDRAMTALLVVQAIGGVVASYRDLTQPFSAAPAVADWIRANGHGLRLIGNPDYAAVPVAAELHQPFFSPESFDFVTFNTQGPASPLMPPANDEANLLAAILRKTGDREMLLIRNTLTDLPIGQPVPVEVTTPGTPPADVVLTPLALFPDSAIESERYTVLSVRLQPRP